jgi:multicomponent Na+:H+ antiporter subunit B
VSRTARLVLGLAALGGLAAVLVAAIGGLEPFGHYPGPYGDVIAKVVPRERHVPQLVAATTFDVRGLDTLGEELILFAAACGCAALMRRRRRDRERDRPPGASRPLPTQAAQAVGAAVVGPVVVLAAYIIANGHITPGGGFVGGVIGAGALLLAYAAGQQVRRLPADSIAMLEGTEALGAGAFVALAIGTLVATGATLRNALPLGTSGMLLSGGTIPVGNVAVGVEVAGALGLVLAEFLDQTLLEERR